MHLKFFFIGLALHLKFFFFGLALDLLALQHPCNLGVSDLALKAQQRMGRINRTGCLIGCIGARAAHILAFFARAKGSIGHTILQAVVAQMRDNLRHTLNLSHIRAEIGISNQFAHLLIFPAGSFNHMHHPDFVAIFGGQER